MNPQQQPPKLVVDKGKEVIDDPEPTPGLYTVATPGRNGNFKVKHLRPMPSAAVLEDA
jgi:hypothetical protein